MSRTCEQLQLFIQIHELELLSYKFELISDEPIYNRTVGYLESMVRTALGDSYIHLCICQLILLIFSKWGVCYLII